jgi:hypothetical protein
VGVVAIDLSLELTDHHRLTDLEFASRANPAALVALGSTKLISDRIQKDRLSIVGTEDPCRATVVDRPRGGGPLAGKSDPGERQTLRF